jgi:hypothetical protein
MVKKAPNRKHVKVDLSNQEPPAPNRVEIAQEAALVENIKKALIGGINLSRSGLEVGDPAFDSALNGIVNGVAVSAIKTVGMEPSYTNLYPADRVPAPEAFRMEERGKTVTIIEQELSTACDNKPGAIQRSLKTKMGGVLQQIHARVKNGG